MDNIKDDKKEEVKAEIIESNNITGVETLEKETKIEEVTEEEEKEFKQVKEIEFKPKRKKAGLLIGILVIAIILITFLLTGFALLNLYNDKILKGISIGSINVENLTIEEATKVLSDKYNSKISEEISLEVDGQTYSITPEELGVNYDIQKAVDEAYNEGRKGNIIQNNFSIMKAFFNKKNIQMSVSYNEEALDNILKDINSKIPNAMLDNTYSVEDDELIVTRGKDGVSIEKEEAKELILKALTDWENKKIEMKIIDAKCPEIDIEKIYEEIYCEPQDASYRTQPFEIIPHKNGIDFDLEKAKKILEDDKEEYIIDLIIKEPKVHTNEIGEEAFPNLLGTCSTKFDVTNVSRTKNVKLALKKIDGVVVMPGETFSYNKTLGKRTAEAGYDYAAGYAGGKVVPMLGGGICQVSSTLYTAVLYANLDIVERYNHMFLTSYIGAGKDATVVYGSLDFRFKNTRKYPIRIKATSNGGVAEVKIYGIKEEVEYDVEIESTILNYISYETIYEEDKTLAPGQEKVEQNGMRGCKSKTYRVLKLNGQEVSRELLSSDTYDAMDKMVKRNTDVIVPPVQEEIVPPISNPSIEQEPNIPELEEVIPPEEVNPPVIEEEVTTPPTIEEEVSTSPEEESETSNEGQPPLEQEGEEPLQEEKNEEE